MSLDCYETELLQIFFQENIDYYAANQKLLINDYSKIENSENKIPLLTHQAYLSSLEAPQVMDAISLRKTTLSLKALNNVSNDWKHYIWTNNPNIIPAEILAIPGVEIHLIDELSSSIVWDELVDMLKKADSDKSIFAKASDLIRYSALEIFGGIYRDLDYQIYKPEEFLRLMKGFNFFGGKEFAYEPTYMGSALVAAIANHPVIIEALRLLKRNLNRIDLPLYLQYPCDKVNKQLYETGPAVITLAFLKKAEAKKDALLPANIIFNWDYARSSTPDSPCYTPNVNFQLGNKTIGADMFCGAWHANKAANPRFYYLKNVNNYLYIAAQDGDEQALALSLKNGADVNYIHPDTKVTSLYIAAQNGHREIVRLLIEAGANLNFAKANGVTALYTAKMNNYSEIISLLLKAGASEAFNYIPPAQGINIDCYGSLNREIFAQEGVDFDARKAEFFKDNIYKLTHPEEYIAANKNPIPLISHQIYFSSKTSPKPIDAVSLDKTIRSINRLNQVSDKWKHFFWTNDETIVPNEIKELANVEIHLIDELDNSILKNELAQTLARGELEKSALSAASDLVRYMALRKFGGFYRDLDYEIYAAAILDLLMQAFNFLAGKEFDGEMNYIGSAFVASIANHPILNIIELLMKRNLNPKDYPSIPEYIKFPCTRYNKQMFEFGPGLLTIAFYLAANKDGNIDLLSPSHVFFNTAYIHYITPGSGCSKPNKPAKFIDYINATKVETIGADMLCGGWTPAEYYDSIYHPENLNSYLYLAAQNGDIEAVKTYLTHGANPTSIFKNGVTPLYIAKQNNHPEIVNLLTKSIIAAPKKVDSTDLGCFEGDSTDVFEQEGIDYYLEDKRLVEHYKNILRNPSLNSNPISLKTHQIYFSIDERIIDDISLDKTITTLTHLNEENNTWEHNIWTNNVDNIPQALKDLPKVRLRLLSELENTILYKELTDILKAAQEDRSLLAQASDVARLMVLFKEGGLYRDLDNQIYRAKELIELLQISNFLGGKERHAEVSFIGNAFLAAIANHPIIKTALEDFIARNLNTAREFLPEYLQYPCKKGIKVIYETGSPVISAAYYKSANQNGNIDIVAPGNVFFNVDYARYVTPNSRCHKADKPAKLDNIIDGEEIHTIAGDLFCGAWQTANQMIYYPENKDIFLYLAAQNGNFNQAVEMLANGANANSLRVNKVPPIFIATQNGYKEIVELLVKRQANLDLIFNGRRIEDFAKYNQQQEIYDYLVNYQLFVAAFEGKLDKVSYFLNKGADIESKHISGATSLYIAAKQGHVDIVVLLIKRGANVNIAIDQGDTPLYIAASEGNTQVCKLLLDAGADKEIIINSYTPLVMATYFGHLDTIELLLNYGVKFINDENHYALRIANFLTTHPEEQGRPEDPEIYPQISELLMNHYFSQMDSLITEFYNNFAPSKTFEVVVVRYSEDLFWIRQEFKTEKVIIYNKGADDLGEFPANCEIRKIANVGFLGGTYLYHIVNYYDQLSDRILFVQGNPYDVRMFLPLVRYQDDLPSKCENILAQCVEITLAAESKKLSDATEETWSRSRYNKFEPVDYDMIDFARKYIDAEISLDEAFYMTWGAEFAVDSAKIKLHPKSHYEVMLPLFNNSHPRADFYIEKLWDKVFKNKIIDNKLFDAASVGATDICKALLDAGANIEATIDGYTPLIAAAYFGHLETVKLLLDYGANILTDKSHLIFSLAQAKQDKITIYKETHQLLMNRYYELLDSGSLVKPQSDSESFEIVVARFNEDLSWLLKEFPYEKITIYNKGADDLGDVPANWKVINLENIGREAQTYLYHIINNYHQLKDKILFLQGYPYDHPLLLPLARYKQADGINCQNIAAICSPAKTLAELSTEAQNQLDSNNVSVKQNLIEYINQYLNPFYDATISVNFVNGAQFAITKEKILNNSKTYYQELIKTLNYPSPVEGYYNERLWDVIFSSSLNAQFFYAAIKGDEYLVTQYLNDGADINSIHNAQATALFVAAKWNHSNIVKLLIDHNANLESALADGATALYTSAYHGNSQITEMLLIAGANPEAKIGNNVVLNAAIQNKRIKDVELLLKYNAKISADHLFTPLMSAEYQKNNSPEHQIISQLIINHYWHRLAIEKPKVKISKDFEVVVVRYKEDLSWLVKEFTDEIITIYNKGPDDLDLSELPINSKIIKIPNVGWLGGTYLYHIITRYDSLAARTLFLQGYPYDQEILTPLVRHKEDIAINCDNLVAKCQNTTLLNESNELSALTERDWATSSRYSAFTQASDYTMLEFVYKFIEAHFDPQAPLKMDLGAQFAIDADKIRNRDKEYYQAMLPLFNQQYPRVDFYLEKLWDVIFGYKAVTSLFDAQLFIAAEAGDVTQIAKLLDQGANINSVHISNATPIYIAAKNGHAAAVALLIRRGANVNAAIDQGDTPLSVSASDGHLEVCELLLKANADKEVIVRELTPLFTALYFGYLEIVKLLLDYGAKSIADQGNYPLRMAALWQTHPGAIPDSARSEIYLQSYDILMNDYLNKIDDLKSKTEDDSSFEVVIVRYNENLAWVKAEFKNEKVIIYNKGTDDLGEFPANCEIRKIENVGFLGGTYLYHIVNYYDQLPARILFLQANPYDMRLFLPLVRYKEELDSECKNIIATCVKTTIGENQDYLKTLDWENTNYPNFDSSNINMTGFAKTYVGDYPIDAPLYVNYGAQFAVDRAKIFCNSREYYQRIFSLFNTRYPIEDHYLERLWDLIFNCDNTYDFTKSPIIESNFSPLYLAVYDEKIDVVKRLLSEGASPSSANPFIQTPIRAAAFFLNRSETSKQIYNLVMEQYWQSPEFLAWQNLPSTKNFEVVVVRYKEDLSWIAREFNSNIKVTIYNKGDDDLDYLPANCNIIKTNNTGYLGGTYLQHIASNYDQLADRVLFLQGNPFDVYIYTPLLKYRDEAPSSCKNIVSVCTVSTIEKENNHLAKLDWNSSIYSNFTLLPDQNMIDFIKKHVGDYPIDAPLYFNYGAEFAVDKEKILCNNIEVYQALLLEFNDTFPMPDHFMERSWDILFNCGNIY